MKFANVLTEDFLRTKYLEEGKSPYVIAQEVGASRETVRLYLKKFHIPFRTHKESLQVHADMAGFRVLSTDWHAYWTGFIAADGCVYVDEYTHKRIVQINLQLADHFHLENLRQGLQTSVKVRTYPHGKYPTATLTIYNADLIDALAQWGIVPHKTLTMPWPAHLPPYLVPSYIRGYFDGDGTVYQRKRVEPATQWTETVCRFISGSVPFLEGLKHELAELGIHTTKMCRNGNSNAYVLPLSSKRENLLTFAHVLYQESTIHLERKREIFREMEIYHATHPRR